MLYPINSIDCTHSMFSTLLLPPWCQLYLPCSCVAGYNWVFPWCRSRKWAGLCVKKPPDQIQSSVFLLFFLYGVRMGRAWLPSQSHGGELESGEPVCLPLLSQRALFVTRHHRLSHHRSPRPHILLSHLFPSCPWWCAIPAHSHHFKGKTCHPALPKWC